jgi:hypothetical protein
VSLAREASGNAARTPRLALSLRTDTTNANSFNISDALGLGIAPVVPAGHYPYQNYAGERLAARYASAVGRDALKNMFREFWPDILLTCCIAARNWTCEKLPQLRLPSEKGRCTSFGVW